LTVTPEPITAPPSTKAWSQMLQSEPITAPGSTWAKAQIRVPGPHAVALAEALGVDEHACVSRHQETAAVTTLTTWSICSSLMCGNSGSESMLAAAASATGKSPGPWPRPAKAPWRWTGTG